MRAVTLRGPFALFRGVLLSVCALLALVHPAHLEALPVVLALLVGAAVAFHWPVAEKFFPYLGAAVAALTTAVTGGDHSPLFPYLIAPGLTLGLTVGVRGVMLASGLASTAFLTVPLLPGVSVSTHYVVTAAEWVVLMLSLGLVASWGRRLSPPPRQDPFVDVHRVLEQLHALTRQLPGGLDASATASALLDRCCVDMPGAKAAVLACMSESAFVPIAVQGTRRVPWRAPLEHAGPLRDAWTSRKEVVDVRPADTGGRRQASSLLALPLKTSDEPFGLLVIESTDIDTFTPEVRDRIRGEAIDSSSQLQAALLFEEVRLAASLEERDRLAREMHDGIAQDLAFVGYRLDDLRGRAAKVSPELGEMAVEVRADLTRLISELRLSITELRSSVRSDRGLGAVLTSYLQAVSAGKDLLLTMTMQETAFRLPAEHEVALLQAAQAFAQEVRRRDDVTTLVVSLTVDPPSASLSMSCDAKALSFDLGKSGETLARIGADVSLSVSSLGGPCLEIVLSGEREHDQRAVGRRPRIDPARAPSSVRAD